MTHWSRKCFGCCDIACLNKLCMKCWLIKCLTNCHMDNCWIDLKLHKTIHDQLSNSMKLYIVSCIDNRHWKYMNRNSNKTDWGCCFMRLTDCLMYGWWVNKLQSQCDGTWLDYVQLLVLYLCMIMQLKIIEWTKKIMSKVQYENSLWKVKSFRCPVMITEDMIWKNIIANVTQNGDGWEVWFSFSLLENTD